MRIIEDLNIDRIIGDKLLIRRIPFPKETKSGLYLPETFIDTKTDVSKEINKPLFQNKGIIIGIGEDVKEGKFNLGDIVHFQPGYYQMAFLDKSDLSLQSLTQEGFINNSEILIDATNGIDWIEKNKS